MKVKLFETNQISLEQWSINKYNSYDYQQLDCRRAVQRIIEWKQRFFFLNLLEKVVQRQLTLRNFYQQFIQKEEEIAEIANEKEYSLDLRSPHPRAATIFSIFSQINSVVDQVYML